MTLTFTKSSRLAWAGIVAVSLGVVAVAIWYASSRETKPDFAAFERVEEKKQAFVEFLRPRIEAANAKVRAERSHIVELRDRYSANTFTDDDCEYIGTYAALYEMESSVAEDVCDDAALMHHVFDTLLRRADTVPIPLALAQAAKESGWGTSRFAVEGNNYFGQHCYVEGCGEMPKRRAPGRKHEVAIFDSSWHSVEAYLRNLNTHPRYQSLRQARQRMRRQGENPTGQKLAEHLEAYSERGRPYINEIKAMIRRNDFK